MKNFNLNSLRDWQPVALGDPLDFPVPAVGYRAVNLEFIADADVSLMAVAGEEYWLVAYGSGLVSVRFATEEPVALVFSGPDGTSVFLRTHVQTQVIPEPEDASFTSIEPRDAGPSDEIKRYMHLVRLNSLRREQMLLDEIANLREPSPQVIEQTAPPAPAAPVVSADKADE